MIYQNTISRFMIIINLVAAFPINDEEYIKFGIESKISKHFLIGSLPNYMSVFKKWKFSKHISVFGVNIIAIDTVPNRKMEHAANVMAQYLDNDENGIPDNLLVLRKILERNATLVMFNNSKDEIVEKFQNAMEHGQYHGFYCQDLEAKETSPKGKFDASLEEILHLISDNGFAIAYPQIFGKSMAIPATSLLSKNMVEMIDNCGYAFNGTFNWPNCTGFYHYKDKECEFSCLQTEYFYWMLTSILGGQDGPLAPKGRSKNIENEWELCNKEKVKKYDIIGYKLMTDERYQLPTKLPNGKYSPKSVVKAIFLR